MIIVTLHIKEINAKEFLERGKITQRFVFKQLIHWST